MSRSKVSGVLSVSCLVFACLLVGLISLPICQGQAQAAKPGLLGAGKLGHVVIIFQENRSTDNLFHDPVLMARGAEIALTGKTSTGQVVQLQPAPLADPWDMGHGHRNFLKSWNGGAMDRFDLDSVNCPPTQPGCAPPNPEYYYVQAQDVAPYFTLAETYAFADHMFQTNQGPSFPAHQYIISGTSALTETSIYDMAENGANAAGTAGCIANPLASVLLIDTTNFNSGTNETTRAYPCSEHPALTDLLDHGNLTWKYYAPSAGSIWTGPDAILHICGPNQAPPNGTQCVGSEWTNHVVIEGSKAQILHDIANGQLANVSWVIPTGAASDHPLSNNGSGPSWVAAIVNAIGSSQYWTDTAIFITWDDWGGWYDHVPPPQPFHNSYEMGFRVPLIVVSPYAKRGYISKQQHDFGSILHFVESVFGLGEIDPLVHYADARADNLSDCFQFTGNPLPFRYVDAPLPGSYFLNNDAPAGPPDDD